MKRRPTFSPHSPPVLLLTALALMLLVPSYGVDISVHFESPGRPIPLRLNGACNGWTHEGWSQYFNDLDVSYRRMDHWNNAFNPVRRLPDGKLWYDYGALDRAIYDATGGYSFKAFPTIDYSPACLTTEFLRNPLQAQPSTAQGSMTPVGTLLFGGAPQKAQPTDDTPFIMSAPFEAGMYEVDRKGNILGHYPCVQSPAPFQSTFFTTAADHVISQDKSKMTYSVLGTGPKRSEIARGNGLVVQEIDGESLLVEVVSGNGVKINQVDFRGKIVKSWGTASPSDPVLWTKFGLVAFDSSAHELSLVNSEGNKEILKAFPATVLPTDCFLASNPEDVSRRIYAVVQVAQSRDDFNISVYAFSSGGKLLWQSPPIQSMYLRGAIAGRNGILAVATAGNLFGVDKAGQLWKQDARGQLNLQRLSCQGMETAVVQTYEDEIREYDLETGDLVWRYGNFQDQSDWLTIPPRDLSGWEDLVYHHIKHFNGDLGLGWDRWELWNEPGPESFFWHGTAQDYGAMLEATMKGVSRADPGILMDAYDSGGSWESDLVSYCNEHKIRLDALSGHLYRPGSEDADVAEQAQIAKMWNALKAYTGSPNKGRALQVDNTEWNIHPGTGSNRQNQFETGYYRAPFQSEMTYLMNKGGLAFSAEFDMVSKIDWPFGWIYTSSSPISGKAPASHAILSFFTPAYNAAKLWSLLPKLEAPVTNNFIPSVTPGNSPHVNAIAGSDPTKGEYAILLWNFSNHAPAAADETVNLHCTFTGESQLHMRHFIIDQDHSTYTKDWDHRYLEAVESGVRSTSDLATQTVVLRKDSLHAFVFTRNSIKANAGQNIVVEAHHPVRFDGSASTGLPSSYRWDVDASDGVGFPDPDSGPPSASHLYGLKPILSRGYSRPGTYTATLCVAADGYQKVSDHATVSVTVLPEKTPPEAPRNLSVDCNKTNHQAFLQWDSLNFARNPDVDSYVVYRKELTGGWEKRVSTGLSTSYVDSELQEGEQYSYRITARDSTGNESPPSSEITAIFHQNRYPPPAPINVRASMFGSLVKLDWEYDNLVDAASVTSYNVYQRPRGTSDWQKLTDNPTWYKRFYVGKTGAAGDKASEYAVTAVDNSKIESQLSKATPSR